MYKKLMFTLVALSALVFSACGGGEETAPVIDEPSMTDPIAPDEDPIMPQDDEPGMQDQDEGMMAPEDTNMVPVELGAMDIQMPESVPAGPVEFIVTNTDSVEQHFIIEGPGMMAELPGELAPGETDMLMMDMEPGEYMVYTFPVDQPEQVTMATLFVMG